MMSAEGIRRASLRDDEMALELDKTLAAIAPHVPADVAATIRAELRKQAWENVCPTCEEAA